MIIDNVGAINERTLVIKKEGESETANFVKVRAFVYPLTGQPHTTDELIEVREKVYANFSTLECLIDMCQCVGDLDGHEVVIERIDFIFLENI